MSSIIVSAHVSNLQQVCELLSSNTERSLCRLSDDIKKAQQLLQITSLAVDTDIQKTMRTDLENLAKNARVNYAEATRKQLKIEEEIKYCWREPIGVEYLSTY